MTDNLVVEKREVIIPIVWPGRSSDIQVKRFDEILELIDPRPEASVVCKEGIALAVWWLKAYAPAVTGQHSPATEMRSVTKLIRLLTEVQTAIASLSFPARVQILSALEEFVPAQEKIATGGTSLSSNCRLAFNLDRSDEMKTKFLDQLDRLRASASSYQRGIIVGAGGPPGDEVRFQASQAALLLLALFAKKNPTKTVGGPFYELASILYEEVTGLKDQNLERYCRKVFRNLKFARKADAR